MEFNGCIFIGFFGFLTVSSGHVGVFFVLGWVITGDDASAAKEKGVVSDVALRIGRGGAMRRPTFKCECLVDEKRRIVVL